MRYGARVSCREIGSEYAPAIEISQAKIGARRATDGAKI